MNYIKFIIFILSGTLFFFSCTEDGVPTEEATNNICECTQPIVKINQQIKALQAQGNIEAFTALAEKAGAAFDAAVKCTQQNTSEKTDKVKLKKALMSKCEVEERMLDDLISKL